MLQQPNMWKIAAIFVLCIASPASSDSDESDSASGCVADDDVMPDSAERRTLLGAYEDVDESRLDSPEIQDVAKFAANEIAARLDSPNGFNLVNVNNAKKQVVAGINYNLDITVIPNQCDRKSEDSQDTDENTSCPPGPCDKALHCDVTVYSIPWLHQMKLDAFECTPDQSTCHNDSRSMNS